MSLKLFQSVGFAMAVTCMALPSVGLAGSITGTTSGSFSNPAGGTATIANGGTTATLGRDTLTWTATTDISSWNVGSPFSLGTLTVAKDPGNQQTGFSLNLTVDLGLTIPGVINDSYPWNMSISSGAFQTVTLGIASSEYDPVSFAGGDGYTYTLQLLGFGTVAGGEFTGIDSFVVPNNPPRSNSANLWASVTRVEQPAPPAVPEPASVFSAAVASLAGLAFAVRRRAAARA